MYDYIPFVITFAVGIFAGIFINIAVSWSIWKRCKKCHCVKNGVPEINYSIPMPSSYQVVDAQEGGST